MLLNLLLVGMCLAGEYRVEYRAKSELFQKTFYCNCQGGFIERKVHLSASSFAYQTIYGHIQRQVQKYEEIQWVSQAVGHHIWTSGTVRLACAESA